MLVAGAVAGCSNKAQVFQDNNEGGLFSKPINVFAKPEWASSVSDSTTINLGPTGPVGAEELVSADGRCAPPLAVEAPQSPVQAETTTAPQADRPVGSVAGDLAGAPMPAAATPSIASGPDPALTPVIGGIALGMTECQTVRRAGLPSNVTISSDKGERKVVLTYLGGTWPGIYSFQSGRLKEISRAPDQPKPAKAVPKKKSRKASR